MIKEILTKIIPKPNGEARDLEGFFRLSSELTADTGDFEPWCLSAFTSRMRENGVSLIRAGGEAQSRAEAQLRLERGDFSPEQYRLELRPGGIRLTAGDERGVILGLTTLYEAFLGGGPGKETPCFTLFDTSRYPRRGFMLDCARHFFNAAEIERILEQMALVKLNVFHWHLSDDQGWRIASAAFPRLNELGDHYTRDEIRHITAFAKERGIEVIPEIDMPGHTSALLTAYPELSCRGEPVTMAQGGGIFKTVLCAGKESVYSFLYRLLDEVCDLFESPFIHLGGDEAPRDEWEQCEHCREALRKNGLASFDDLQARFTSRLVEHLAKKGKRVICWNDALKAASPPRNIDIQYWIEWGGGGYLQSFLDQGGTVVFSDMFTLYFDYPECFTSVEKVYHYEPGIGGNPREKTAGIEACLWTERIAAPLALEQKIFPRLFALAEAAWTTQRDYPDFERRLDAKLRRLAESGIGFTPLEDCNPQGTRREAEIAQFWKEFAQFTQNTDALPPAMIEEMLTALIRGFNLPGSPVSV